MTENWRKSTWSIMLFDAGRHVPSSLINVSSEHCQSASDKRWFRFQLFHVELTQYAALCDRPQKP